VIRIPAAPCLTLAALIICPSSRAQTAHYPPDLRADFHHMRLDITIEDMNTPVLRAVQKLELEPIAYPMSELTLDAKLIDIAEARSPGRGVSFESDGEQVTYSFDPPVAPAERIDLYTRYTVTNPPEGLYWTPETAEWPGRAAQIHTQGEPETNSYWFPCHDYPNDRLTTEIVATVPKGFVVSSNGRLLSRESPTGDTVRFHWLQDQPHVPYLVSLIVGQFDIVDLGTDDLPMPVYVPPGRASDVEGTYGRTPDMIDFFSHRFDEPYPWDRYAQLVVWNFNFGGMENTSATTMHDTAILSADARLDHELTGLIAHELAHQWFGDLITCDSWDHIWLNEGFATYSESLWLEHDEGLDAYQADVLANFDRVIAADSGAAPEAPGMVSNVYHRPLDNFFKPANPYSKGASVLHMLRMRLGDIPFFSGLGAYIDEHKFDQVETPDFRKAMEEASGASLEQFFDQWTSRPGIPRLKITSVWEEEASELVITITQTQTINGDNPAYVFTLPVWIKAGTWTSATTTTEVINIDRRRTEARIPLSAPPTLVAFDPGMHVLAEMTIDQDHELWHAQAQRGPSLYARIQAIRALAQGPGANEDTALLSTVAGSDRHHEVVRREAIAALGVRAGQSDAEALLALDLDAPALQVARIAALASMELSLNAAESRGSLIRAAATDRATTVRAAAMTAIGNLQLSSHFDLLAAGVNQESQHDSVRRAAITALGAFDADPRSLQLVLPFTKRGYLSSTRATAIEAAVRLGAPEESFEHVYAFLGDYERRVHRAAGQAIVDRALPTGIRPLESFAESTGDRREREDATTWLEALEMRLKNDR
jgi:aminopeptidase N